MAEEIVENEEEIEESRRIEFPCDECGADMRWDPEADALGCEYCGNRTEVPRAAGEIVERGLDEAPDAARGLGVELRVAQCGNCGARVTLRKAATVERMKRTTRSGKCMALMRNARYVASDPRASPSRA